jgi:uncharacterized cupin superfamily protein
MPKLDISTVPARQGVGYPAPFAALTKDRLRKRLGDAAGLDDF